MARAARKTAKEEKAQSRQKVMSAMTVTDLFLSISGK
jgi:hypothetical protein